MNPFIKIGGRNIRLDYRALVIAEIGINHEDSLKVDKGMVAAADCAGGEVVKVQTHIEEVDMRGATKKVIPGNSDVSIYKITEPYFLNEENELAIKNLLESKVLVFIATPFSRAAANRLKKLIFLPVKLDQENTIIFPFWSTFVPSESWSF